MFSPGEGLKKKQKQKTNHLSSEVDITNEGSFLFSKELKKCQLLSPVQGHKHSPPRASDGTDAGAARLSGAPPGAAKRRRHRDAPPKHRSCLM